MKAVGIFVEAGSVSLRRSSVTEDWALVLDGDVAGVLQYYCTIIIRSKFCFRRTSFTACLVR